MDPVIPLFVNHAVSNLDEVRTAAARDNRVLVLEVHGNEITDKIRHAVTNGARRVLVAGGDGTIAAGAHAVAGTDVTMGILPLGTLNHFARDFGIPLDIDEALDVALGSKVDTIDVGFLNDRIFVNTSSVGSYVKFVLTRNRYRPWCGYYLSSLIAAVSALTRFPKFRVNIQVNGEERRYVTPIVFIGVDERETKLPELGARRKNGSRGLHVLIVRGKTRASLLTLAFAAAAHGLRRVSRTPHVDAFLVDECWVDTPGASALAGIDGEIEPFETPLHYRLGKNLICVAVKRETRNG